MAVGKPHGPPTVRTTAREVARSLLDLHPASMQWGAKTLATESASQGQNAKCFCSKHPENDKHYQRGMRRRHAHTRSWPANAEKQPPKPRTKRDRISPTHRKGNSQSLPPHQQHMGRTPFGPVPNPSDLSHNQLRDDRGCANSTSPIPKSHSPGSHTRTAYPLPIGATADKEEPVHPALINEDIEMCSQDSGHDNGDEGNPSPDTGNTQDGPSSQCPPIPQQDTQSMQNTQGTPDDGVPPPQSPFALANKNSGAQFKLTSPTEMLTEACFLGRHPTHKAENPHHKAHPYEQTLSGPEDVRATRPLSHLLHKFTLVGVPPPEVPIGKCKYNVTSRD
ncbi:hypothetical protein B0H14DRAFT_2654629 [Mycena olivaceomarginata]|nr:hypothetical protein B0H14DRAFT_2654629 [Mycena olivaceomarginata]